MISSKLAQSAAVFLLLGQGAIASDLMEPPAPGKAMTSDWTGGYIGLMGTYWNVVAYEVTGVVGFNFMPSESFLLGLEAMVGYYNQPPFGNFWDAAVGARAGVVNGPALWFGTVGYEQDFGTGFGVPYVGGGAEFSVADNVSLRVQALDFIGTTNPTYSASAGLVLHLN